MNENREFECQQINKMLEFQDVDLQYTALNDKVTKSDVALNLMKAKNERLRAVEEVKRINTLTEELFKNFETITAQYETVKKEIDDINKCIEADRENLESEDYFAKQLEKYDAKIDELMDIMDQLATELNHKRSEFKAEMDAANKAAAYEKKYQGEFMQLRQDNMNEAKELKSKMDKLRSEVKDENLYNAYQTAKKRGIKRVLVPYRTTSDMHVCGGCGVEVNIAVREKFEAGATRVECPNCGRIIYKTED